MIIFKNMLSFALTFKAYDWFVSGGVKETMLPIAIVQVVICLLSVPMCTSRLPPSSPLLSTEVAPVANGTLDIYGKRVRAFYHKHDVLALTGLR
jgi:hypothetical protein